MSPATLSQSTQGLGGGRSWWTCVSEHPFPPTPACPPAWSRGPSPDAASAAGRSWYPAQWRGQRLGMLRRSKQGVLPVPSSSDMLAFSGIAGSWYHFQLRSGPVWAGGEEEKGRRQREAERDREKQREREAERDGSRQRERQTVHFSSVHSLSRVRLFATPWPAARQASLSIATSRSLLKLMSIESVMPSNHLILCHPLLLLPSIFPSIRVFSNEPALCIRWPEYWSFIFSITPSHEYLGLVSFRMDWLDLLEVQETVKSLLPHHSSKASILGHSAFFTVQLSHPYVTPGKTIALSRWTFVERRRQRGKDGCRKREKQREVGFSARHPV